MGGFDLFDKLTRLYLDPIKEVVLDIVWVRKSVVIVQMCILRDFTVGLRKTDCDPLPAGANVGVKEMFFPKQTKDFFTLYD